MRPALIVLVALLWVTAMPGGAEEFEFDPSEFEKPPLQVNGYLEGKGESLWFDRSSALYRLNSAMGSPDEERGTVNAEVRVRYEQGPVAGFGTLHGVLQTGAGGAWDARLFEGGITLQPLSRLTVDAGKKALRWGKGYGWSPIGFLERPKDPTDPDLSREGYWMAIGDSVWSLDGPVTTVGITPVLVPVTSSLNRELGSGDDLLFGGKIYLLYDNTDIDVVLLGSTSGRMRLGADFSRNLRSNLEVHGEVGYDSRAPSAELLGNRRVVFRDKAALSYLLGLRYLTESETTWILEYYHNGSGRSPSELRNFYLLADQAVSDLEFHGTGDLLQKARVLSQSGYGGPTSGLDYLFLRASQKEPFDLLDFTPSMTCLANLGDGSLSLVPELLYTGMEDLEFRLRLGFNLGGRLTEFGERQADSRIEMRVRYFF